MKKALYIIICSLCLCWNDIYAQDTTISRCGYSIIEAAMIARDPGYLEKLKIKLDNQEKLLALSRNTNVTSTPIATVPIVFHIVLDSAQLHSIGDSAGVIDRINSQIAVLNTDYNRQNADSILIPDGFKPLYGSVNIKFGLAHTDANGNATPGFEIVLTTQTGFEITSQNGGADAKYASTGGADAWDPTRYINVWVINMLTNGQTSTILGITVAADYGFPLAETGIDVNYKAFGDRTSNTELFYTSYDKGRTLTHEVGHYFGLYHPWGDDYGLCPDNGGRDDGIADTPPEADASYGCYTFPHYDNCTSTGNGIMFMNYMDYSDDACMDMFTHDQIVVMQNSVSPGGMNYSITTHPELLEYPGGGAADNSFSISPNPTANGKFSIKFDQLPQNFKEIIVRDITGRKVAEINTASLSTNTFPVDLSASGRGMYFVECYFGSGKTVKKIIRL